MLCALSIYTVYSFRQRKSNAVFLAKTYVIVVFVSNLLALFSDEFEPTGLGSLQQVIRGLVWAIIWYTYLCVSKQIREIIPKEYRKLRNSDYGILVTFIILPLLILSIAIGSIQNSRQDEALNFIEKVELKDGEYTDGRIVFKLPAGFSCKKEETDGFVFYSVENEEVGTATICSDYDNDKSVKNIQSYWANWEDEDAKPYESSIINNEKEERNGHSIFKIVKKYNIDGTFVFWRFLMLFDDASSKVCVISCYDNGVDYYVDELSNSIRFN